METELAEILGYTLLFVGVYAAKSIFGFVMKWSKEKNNKEWRAKENQWRNENRLWRDELKNEVLEVLGGMKDQITLLNDKFDALSENLHTELKLQNKKIDLLEDQIKTEQKQRQRFEEQITGELGKMQTSFTKALTKLQGGRRTKTRSLETDPPPPPDDPNRPPKGPGNG